MGVHGTLSACSIYTAIVAMCYQIQNEYGFYESREGIPIVLYACTIEIIRVFPNF